MAYVKPGTTENLGIDQIQPKPGTGAATISLSGLTTEPVQVTKNGFGIRDPYTGTIEILDAMPLGRASVQEAVELGSLAAITPVDFATEDYLTETEIDDLVARDSDLATSDLT